MAQGLGRSKRAGHGGSRTYDTAAPEWFRVVSSSAMVGHGRSLVVLGLWLVACGGTRPPAAAAPAPPPPALAEIPGLEAAREARTGRLIELSRSPEPVVRERAVRALTRVGDEAALAALADLARSPDAAVQAAALWGLGVAGGGDGVEQREAALLQLYGGSKTDVARVAVLEALGRIASAASLRVLAAALSDGASDVRTAAGLAVGMFGRRAIPLDGRVRDALYASDGHVDPEVRYAMAYALAREHAPPQTGADAERAVDVLSRLATDADPEVRIQAVLGLSKREQAGPEHLIAALGDFDWRVRLQAVTALAGDRYGVNGHAEAAEQLVREWGLAFGSPAGVASAHVLMEGLRALRMVGAEAPVQAAASALAADAAARLAAGDLDDAHTLIASMVHCQALAVVTGAGAAELAGLRECGGKQRRGWPRHARRALLAEVLVARAQAADEARAWLDELATDRDPRVRAAVLGNALALARLDPSWDEPVQRWLAAGIADREIEVAGTAADAIAGALADETLAARGYASLGAALAERARAGAGDVELALTFLTALRDGRLAAGESACRAARSDGNRAVRAIARACIEALTGTDPGAAPPTRATPAPDVDPTALLGKQVVWTLVTTRGPIEIALEPDRAPWHVAVLAKLTSAGFYDGLMWHRVAAGFVVQGGAPGDSAWGGPGFVIPGEPSPGRYDRGTVGIADAGMDTGGSQIFLMHARAPHLEGRYTIVGKVTNGIDTMNALLVGDRIVTATIRVVE